MGSRVVSISGPEITKPVLPVSTDVGRDFDDRDIAERKTFLELGPEDSERLGRLHALIEPDKNAFAGAFHTHILRLDPLRRLVPDVSSLDHLRAAQSEYFSRLTSPGVVSTPFHDDRQMAGHAVDWRASGSR
jgi:hypothetical protein